MRTVKKLDLNKYMGRWYEIARLPFFQEKDLMNTTATYSLLKNGKVRVLNEGYKFTPDGKHKKAKGKAWIPDKDEPGKLKVRFFGLFGSEYNVLDLTEDYKYALVASSGGSLTWFLSKEPTMPEDIFERFKETARKNNINLSDLIIVKQEWGKN